MGACAKKKEAASQESIVCSSPTRLDRLGRDMDGGQDGHHDDDKDEVEDEEEDEEGLRRVCRKNHE